MKSKLYTTTVLIIAIVIVVNLIATEFHLRLDLTEDNQYTLSRATQDIVSDLEEPITIKAYFSENLPPDIAKTRKDFRDLLIEYANLSDGQILYEFINPNEKESNEQQATENGIRPVLINVREKDQVKQQKAFLGATVELGDKKETIPFIQPGAAMEYALSSAIKKISIDNKPIIGLLQGHGEPSRSEMPQLMEQLNVMYEVQDITLTDTTDVPEKIKTLVLIRPTDSIPPSHLEKLDHFISKGGRMFIGLNTVQADFRSLYGSALSTGLEDWLKSKGVDIQTNFIVDAQCGSVSVPQNLGIFTVQSNISFPYVPVIGTFSDHAITSGLESIMMEFASEVKIISDTTWKATTLAFSSDLSNTMPAPQFMDINKEWKESDFERENIPVAVALESAASRLVVVGDGDFPVNGPYQQQRRLQPDNVNFLSNAVDWLSDDTGLIELRTKGAVTRPIREMDDATKTILKYTNFLLPILLVVAYGIFRSQRNRLIRSRRMRENYEVA